VTLMYTSAPIGTTDDGFEVFDLLAVRQEVELGGETITDARVDFDQFTNVPEVTMTMNSEGSRIWARLTGANVNRNVAIVLDNVVYSYPNVEQRITGGRSNISGLDSREEAQDIVTVLKSGALPAPVEIVEERTVGPSLGAASISAGLNSVALGLLMVAVFMVFYYRTGGVIADLALFLNLIFVLGILAGFNATLTLPGIAGIVLTIGMAVDANVLIFERIREEQNTGRTLKAAISGGYAKALSAIFDANITTFFVGVILYSFGIGPIQGFAVTLMAGILSSMFTAIVLTRIISDYLVIERRKTISFG
jgi:protein-export membrane protein SecD